MFIVYSMTEEEQILATFAESKNLIDMSRKVSISVKYGMVIKNQFLEISNMLHQYQISGNEKPIVTASNTTIDYNQLQI